MPSLSSSSPISRAVRTAAALAVLGVAAPRGAEAQQGVTFTYQVKSTVATAATKGGGGAPLMTTTVRAAGPNMRIEWREGSPGVAMMKPGGYMLIRGDDKTLYMVSPQDKAAMLIDGQSMGMGAGAATNNALVKVSQKDSKFDFQDLGAGDKILGYPTRHVRFTSGGTTEVRVMGRTTASTESSTGEAWIATNIKGVDAEALRQWGQAFGRGLRRTNADLVPRLADYDRQYGNGLALRTLMVSSSTDDKGRARTDTMRMEITEITAAKIDPSLFEVPKDYQVADMRQMSAALDSIRKSSGLDTLKAGELMKEGAKESTRDAVKGALGGFMRRKKP